MGTVENVSSDGGPPGRERGGAVSQEQINELVDGGDGDLSLDDVFDLLRNQRRRRVLEYLRSNTDGSATLDELAEHIAAMENDVPIEQLTSSQRKRVYIGLYQCHLPKLDEHSVVEYDQDRGTIVLQDLSLIEPYLNGLEERTDSNRSATLLYAVGGIGFVVLLGIIGVGPLSALPSATWAILSTLALFVLTAWQYR